MACSEEMIEGSEIRDLFTKVYTVVDNEGLL